ncbi:MAG TPA: SPASM domain-containing protein, partial [Bryobacteraceae bacterium]|nr:SPASM domain-containing protein [Bryobacteraceae bacterium]
TYQRNREKGRLEEVLEGVRRVVAEKRRLGRATPLVNFRFIVMKHSEHEVPRLREFARGLGVDCLTLRKLHFVPGTSEGGELVPSEVQFQLPALSEDGKAAVRVSSNPCRNLWNCPTVHWDGTVCSCFMDYNEGRPLGSLRQRSFRDIWYGPEYAKLRREFRDHWRQLPLCGVCSSGYADGDVGKQANAEVTFFD